MRRKERPVRPDDPIGIWLAIFGCSIFLIVGLVMIWGGFHAHLHRSDFLAHAVTARGIVLRLHADHIKKGTTTYSPVVRFLPSGAAAAIEFTSRTGDSDPKYHPGQIVPVLYRPERPSEADVADSAQSPALEFVLWGMGFLFTLAGAGTLAMTGGASFLRSLPQRLRKRG